MNKNPAIVRACCALLLTLLCVQAQADVLSESVERGSIRVGVSLFTPWTMEAEEGELIGFEIDVTRKLAQDMGIKAEYQVYAWEDIISALQKGEIDLIAAGIAITPQRALKINFSIPYDEWGATLVTNIAETRDVESLAQLNGPATVMVTVGETFAHQVAGHLFDLVDMRIVTSAAEAEKMVVAGDADAYLVSGPEAYFLALANPGVVDLPLGEPLVESRAGFGVRRGEQEWLNYLNSWIQAREADKWIETAHHYWFKTVQWRATEKAEPTE
jgi:polar amino acid transport system substrate-binding protein